MVIVCSQFLLLNFHSNFQLLWANWAYNFSNSLQCTNTQVFWWAYVVNKIITISDNLHFSMQGNMYILYIRVTSYFKVELPSEHGNLTSDLLICIKILAMVLTSLFLSFFVSFTAMCAWKAGYSHHYCIYVFACVCLDKFSLLEFWIFHFKSSWYNCELIFPVSSSVSNCQLPKCLTKCFD